MGLVKAIPHWMKTAARARGCVVAIMVGERGDEVELALVPLAGTGPTVERTFSRAMYEEDGERCWRMVLEEHERRSQQPN